MKKLSVVMAALLVASGAVMAQDNETAAGGPGTGTIGGIATGSLVAGVVATGVIVGIVSNNRTDAAPEDEDDATCATGFTGPVNGVCTGSTVTKTGAGTNTKTTTVAITRPAQ